MFDDHAAVPPEPWRPRWLHAVLLSLASPGAGHLYAGSPAGALSMVLGMIVGIPGIILFGCGVDSRAFRIAALLLIPILYLVVGPTSAALMAWRQRPGAPRWFQRQYVVVGAAFAFLAMFLLVRTLVWHPFVRVYRIHGNSMFPTLLDQERVVARRIGNRNLSRGDIVSYEPARGRLFVARIVGLPGDTLVMRGFRATVNGVREPDGPTPCARALGLASTDPADDAFASFGPIRVPDGHYFLLGDCRDNARDSRELGFIPRERISKQVVWWLYSPVTSRIGTGVGTAAADVGD